MKMTKQVRDNRAREADAARHPNRVENFMGGTSYELGAVDTMKMVTASSIFGEPAYYRDGEFSDMRVKDGLYAVDELFAKYAVLQMDKYGGMTTSQLMEKVISDALDEDFGAVLEWARVLRSEYGMRLNPQVIMVMAAMHPARAGFTERNPSVFGETNLAVMSRADDVIGQLTYYLYKNGSKKTVPGILKRTWAKKIESLTRYEMAKYRNHGIGLVDTIRICHAKGRDVDELMRTGTIAVEAGQKTWETLRAGGMAWKDITEQIRMPHMALLRNLRGIFQETEDVALCDKLMAQLVEGVAGGKQFPFRYMSAMTAISSASDVNHAERIKDGLEDCMDAACANLPRLKGRSAFLCDNSGSAWGTCASEYGSVTVAKIGNLSAVIGAVNSDEGYVFPFGDRLHKHEVSRRKGILAQAEEISGTARKGGSKGVGGSTENGIWLFFENAIDKKEHWDNIFVYSDQQAGHGGLYGTDEGIARYRKAGFLVQGSYNECVDVAKLIEAYRRKVNPRVNVFTIQTAGYDNVLVPENGYRTSVLYGWTGRELVYANAMNRFWDEQDDRHGQAPARS